MNADGSGILDDGMTIFDGINTHPTIEGPVRDNISTENKHIKNGQHPVWMRFIYIDHKNLDFPSYKYSISQGSDMV